jgi:hypothetical protein
LQEKVREGLSRSEGLEGMTVNERLYVTGLLETFESLNGTNEVFARFILESLRVDNDSVEKILK